VSSNDPQAMPLLLDFSVRVAEKQRSRELDERALATGAKTSADLRRENAVFREIAREPIRWRSHR